MTVLPTNSNLELETLFYFFSFYDKHIHIQKKKIRSTALFFPYLRSVILAWGRHAPSRIWGRLVWQAPMAVMRTTSTQIMLNPMSCSVAELAQTQTVLTMAMAALKIDSLLPTVICWLLRGIKEASSSERYSVGRNKISKFFGPCRNKVFNFYLQWSAFLKDIIPAEHKEHGIFRGIPTVWHSKARSSVSSFHDHLLLLRITFLPPVSLIYAPLESIYPIVTYYAILR